MVSKEKLVELVTRAVAEGWWYILGGYINKGTEPWLTNKIAQYEYNQRYEDKIRAYVKRCLDGGRVPMFSDCYGLIKGSAWYDDAKGAAIYQKDGMLDRNQAGAMTAAQRFGGKTAEQNRGITWGTIDTVPEIPGICLWKNGHAGVYIGNGEFIHIYNGAYPAKLVKVSSYNWTHWFKDTYVDYGGVDYMSFKAGVEKGRLDVGLWQVILIALGYDLGAYGPNGDGVDLSYGPKGQAATIDFKSKNGMAADTVVDSTVLSKALSALKAKIAFGGAERIAELEDLLAKANKTISDLSNKLETAEGMVADLQEDLIVANRGNADKLLDLKTLATNDAVGAAVLRKYAP